MSGKAFADESKNELNKMKLNLETFPPIENPYFRLATREVVKQPALEFETHKVIKISIIVFTFVLLLTFSSSGYQLIGGPGNVAVVNLGTRFNTTVTLKWSGFTGGTTFRTIYITLHPPPTGRKQWHLLTRIASWKDSCVVNGLPPGTYYWMIEKVNTVQHTNSFSNVSRIVVQ